MHKVKALPSAGGALAVLALVILVWAPVPAQSDPHPGQSVDVAVVASTDCQNGGSFPTTSSGPTGAFTDFNFTDVGVSEVSAATLAGYDTVLLNICSSAGPNGDGVDAFNCDVNKLSNSQKTDLVNFNQNGGKLIIYDSECSPQNYSWLPFPFTTANPGAQGGTGTVNIVENNLLGSDVSSNVHFIDKTLLGQQTDAVGDMNVLTTTDPNLCLHMSGTNVAQQTGPTHVYWRFGSGIGIYNGFDVDFLSGGSYFSTSPDSSTPDGNIAKVWLQELQQPLDGQGLSCGVAVVGIALAPQDATNDVGTSHTVTATVTDQGGDPQQGVLVTFTVAGDNAGASGTCNPASCESDSNGEVAFTYTGNNAGEDQITACFTPEGGGDEVCSAPATKTWTAAEDGVGSASARGTAFNHITAEDAQFSAITNCDEAQNTRPFIVRWTEGATTHTFTRTSTDTSTCTNVGGSDTNSGTGAGTIDGTTDASLEWTFSNDADHVLIRIVTVDQGPVVFIDEAPGPLLGTSGGVWVFGNLPWPAGGGP